MKFFIPFLFVLGLSAFANAQQAVCVRVEKAGVFQNPNPKKAAKPLYEADKYTPMTFTGKREGRYMQVENYKGDNVWVRARDVSSNITCVTVRVGKSRLRKGPGDEFPKSELANQGQSYLDLGGEDGWTLVENTEGQKSWIQLEHIWRPTSRVRMSFTGDEAR